MLADLLSSRERWIVSYHEHDSLLENKIDEELSEEDRKAAWEEYEAEKKGLRQMASSSYDSQYYIEKRGEGGREGVVVGEGGRREERCGRGCHGRNIWQRRKDYDRWLLVLMIVSII